MRPLAARLLIACVLAFAQAGGVMHALSHLAPPDKSLPAGTAHLHHCPLCDAYDALGHGAAQAQNPEIALSPGGSPAALPDHGLCPALLFPLPIRAPPLGLANGLCGGPALRSLEAVSATRGLVNSWGRSSESDEMDFRNDDGLLRRG